ncbi:reverse transcriptase domain-containing protein [Tanacetum coccineum]
MKELRRKLFAGTDDEDAHEHVRRVLEIVNLFHFLGVTHDVVMLRVFPITLKGRALRWKKRLPSLVINTWDFLKKEFIWQYCSPFKTAKKLEEIHDFKQEMYETLYQAWEKYNDLLFKCPQHDLNNHQKVQIFYTGLDISTRKLLDSRGFITLMTPTQALKSIQVMADHSHNWYDETTTKEKINDNPDNIDDIQESFKEAHLTKECPLKREDGAAEQREKRTTIGKGNMKEAVPRDLPPMPFIGHLKEQIGDIDVGWDITVKDVKRLRQFLTPTIHTLPNLEPAVQPYMPLGPVYDKEKIVKEEEQDYDIPLHDGVMQPLTSYTVHITPPDDDYVTPATSPTLDKQLNEFGEECSDITRVADKANGNPVKDVQELSDINTYDCETFIRKLLHQVPAARRQISRLSRPVLVW